MREFTCIICPNGCLLAVESDGSVSGNACKRGLEFAVQETTDPKRSLTTTVKTVFSDCPVVPVKSSKPIKKGLILDCMAEVNKFELKERLPIGSVVIKNIMDSGVDIILTSNKLKEI